MIDETGEGLRQLTAARVNDDDPAWSREGGRIVFARIVFASGKDRSAIWVMRADGKQQHRLTPNGSDYEPAWSRDGRRIAFSRIKNASWTKADIWLIGAKGGRARKLIADGLSPSWSPDGSRIAFTSPSSGGIFVVNADGRGRHRVGDGGSPSWSPDGHRIAFLGAGGIHVMDADGRNDHCIRPGLPEMSGTAWGSG